MKLSRRTFLKGTAALASIAALGYRAAPGSELDILKSASAEQPTADEWIYSACNMCGGQSGIVCHVVNGALVKIEPNRYNPIGVHNISGDFEKQKDIRGARLCSKGNSGIKSLYDPDRIKTPMKRVGGRGEGKWQPISWDEAVNEVATRLGEIKGKYGAESLVWFAEDHSLDNDLQSEFCKAYGTPNFHVHANLCDVARKASFKLTMGDERPVGDFAHAKYILLFGWNPLVATKWAHLPAIFMDGIANGAKMVVVDPVFSNTAAKAHEWVPIRPGTDGALALAMANVIVGENLYDRDFVEAWTVGFNEFKDFVKDKTPEWGEKITSVPADTIRRLAREVATTKPACIDVWSGPGQQGNGTEGGRAIAMLAGLLGQVDKPGTMMNPDRKGPKKRADLPEWPKITAERLDGRGKKYPFAHSSGIYVETREAMLSGKPYQSKAAVFVMQNFAMSVPNPQKNIDAISKMDFVVVLDTHMSETGELADILIPGTNYLERYDPSPNWVTFQSVSLRQPVVPSWINGISEDEFIMRVATKMGLKGFDMPYEQYLSDKLKGGIGVTLDELKKLPGAVWIGKGTTYEKYKATVTVPEGSTTDPATGIVKSKDGNVLGVDIGGAVYKGFNTPSKKFEFYSKQMKDKGLNPLPEYTETEDRPNAEYPYYFVSWKPAEHTHTRTQNNVWLVEMLGDNPLWINPRTAAKLGIAEGDLVYVESPTGKFKDRVHVTEGIHPEVVAFPRGFGHWALGKVAKGRGAHDGMVIPGKAEKISGMARNKEAAVKIYKVGAVI